MKKTFFSQSTLNKYIDEIIHELDTTKQSLKLKSVFNWLDWHKVNNSISLSDYHLARNMLQSKVSNVLKSSNISQSSNRNFVVGISILALIISFISFYFSLSDAFNSNTITSEKSPPILLPFNGVLKDIDGIPITDKRDVLFRLYPKEEGGQPVYSGECIGEQGLTPEVDGSFTIVLGSDCGMSPISQDIIDTHDVLFLGVQIGDEAEIVPRTHVSTGKSGENASMLQNLSLGSVAGSIPFINASNILELTESNPKLLSTNGLFTFEGQKLLIKTTLEQGGDIMIQPAIGANTLFTSGKVGLGILEPQHKFSVLGIEPYESIMSVVNLSPEDVRSSSVVDLSVGALKDGINATFVNFNAEASRDDPGVNVGRIRLGNGGVVYETKGADFAEYFETEHRDLFITHMIVGINTDGIVPATREDRLVGVTTDTPGFVGNSNDHERESSILVGLMGQVTVLVSTENGSIKKGDVISASFIPGYGAKELSAEFDTIGIALEDFDKNTSIQDVCPHMYYISEDDEQRDTACGKIRILLDVTR
ncbi:MAG: hypothetical protein O3B87_00625 [bacterium]|nr:hypothetical protein [bacterium]